ncbi:Phage protein [Salmonella phage Tennessee]
MNKFIIALAISAVSFGSLASTKVFMKNGNVKVQQNGIITEYGKVRDIKERNGKVEIYTNKNFSTPAVTVSKRGEITTQRTNSSSSSSFTCRYDCDFEGEDE